MIVLNGSTCYVTILDSIIALWLLPMALALRSVRGRFVTYPLCTSSLAGGQWQTLFPGPSHAASFRASHSLFCSSTRLFYLWRRKAVGNWCIFSGIWKYDDGPSPLPRGYSPISHTPSRYTGFALLQITRNTTARRQHWLDGLTGRAREQANVLHRHEPAGGEQ